MYVSYHSVYTVQRHTYGLLKLGNLLGALLNWAKLQRESQPNDRLIFSIVGWHALTLPQNPQALSASRRDMLAVLLAIGIDPKRSIIFHQDEVSITSLRMCGVPNEIGFTRILTTQSWHGY